MGLTVGQFAARDRAEVAIFLAFRPWALLVPAAMLARRPLRWRLCGYVLALLAASGGEALLVALLGGARVLADAVRAILAGLLLAVLLDLAFLVARRAEPRFARLLGLLLGLGLLLVPGPTRLFERVALRAPPQPVPGPRPAVSLLTGLPILWGEGDPLTAGPNAIARRLAAEFSLRPIDVATPKALAAAPLLLAAQPREVTPAEIVAIDAWVHGGGRALLLADPNLRWPSALPPDDARRAPRWLTLAPLLARWGIGLSRGAAGIGTIDLSTSVGDRRIVVDSPGTIQAAANCHVFAASRAAACAVGLGRVLILADADMLDDRLWVAPGADGDSRLRRGGDNALLVVEWLDRLAGNRRDRRDESVSWRTGRVSSGAILAALFPGLLLGLAGGLCGSSHPGR